jgi:hypothetical protein
MPVRKVSNRGGNLVGRFPSLKMERMVAFESLIERDFIYLLDFEQDVEWFAEQPVTISYQYQGKTRKYTPDFHVIRNGQDTLVECKPEKRVHSTENQRKFAAAQLWCSTRGWTFQVVTDTQLRSGYRLQNVKLLTQFARYDISPGAKTRIRAFLSVASSPVTVADVMAHAAPNKPRSATIPVLHMAFHHELVVPLDNAPISADSSVALVPVLRAGRDS